MEHDEKLQLIAQVIAWTEGEDVQGITDWTLWLDSAQQFTEDLNVMWSPA
jgi:hypothetical protein